MNIDTYCEKHLDVPDINLIDDIIAELISSNVIKSHRKRSAYISEKGKDAIRKHGSYSSYLSSIQYKTRRKTILNSIKTVSDIGQKILMALLAVLTFVLSYLKYQDDKTIDGLEGQVDSLTKKIEALKVPQIVVPSDSSIVTETVKEKK